VEDQADDVVRALVVERLLQRGVDHVIGRCDHVAQGADAARVIAKGTECTNVGHENALVERLYGAREGRYLSEALRRPAIKGPPVPDASLNAILATRLAAVEERLHAACGRAGRQRSDVTLVAVTKTVSPDVAAALHRLRVVDLAENRPQE